MHIRWRTTALVAAVLAACISCGSTQPGASSVDLHAVADSMNSLLARDFSASYAGIELDERNGKVVVYRVPDRALDDAIQARSESVYIVLKDAKFPLTRVREVTNQITADIDYWRQRGINIAVVGPRADGSGVEVSTTSGSENDQETTLSTRYGADIVHVVHGGPLILPTAKPVVVLPPGVR